MTKSKNPMRQLATSIVLACKSDGLKQSVVLNALTKHAGFRSIQASDSVVNDAQPGPTGKTSNQSLPEHVKAYLKGVACNALYESMSYDFIAEGADLATRKSTGDSLSFYILKELEANPIELINNLPDYTAKAEAIAESMEDNVRDKTEKEVGEFIATYELPNELADAILTEVMDGSDNSDELEQWVLNASRLAHNQYRDLDSLNNAFQSSMIVDQLLSGSF